LNNFTPFDKNFTPFPGTATLIVRSAPVLIWRRYHKPVPCEQILHVKFISRKWHRYFSHALDGVLRCMQCKIGGPAPWCKIREVQNFRGTNFQCDYHYTVIQNLRFGQQMNVAPHCSERHCHMCSSNSIDIEVLFCRGKENYTI
jgi:hypothetical protein